MKSRIFLTLVIALCVGQLAWAQSLVSTKPYHRVIVLEEFTGINCGYCPDGHRLATLLYNKYNQEPVLINIHSGGYAEPSSTEPDFRTEFGEAIDQQAQVTGYPAGTINRHFFPALSASPSTNGTSMGRGDWDLAAPVEMNMDSPVNVGLHSTFDPVTRLLTVDVEAYYTGDSPAPQNRMNVVLLENDVIGFQEDYANGNHDEYHHMHMLRWMLTGQWGDEILVTTQGTLFKKTYTYTVPDNFDVANCDVAAFVAEDQQEIYTGAKVAAMGGTTQQVGEMSTDGPIAKTVATKTDGQFSAQLKNILGADETYTLEVVPHIPSDWSIKTMVDGKEYTGGEFTIANGSSQDLSVQFMPSDSSAVASVDVYLHSKTYPMSPQIKKTFYYMSGVKNLLMSHPDALTFDSVYVQAMASAGISSTGKMDRNVFEIFSDNNALSGLQSVWYNVSWAFPGITDVSMQALKTLMDNGTHVLAAGQDFGWDLASTDTNAHSTSATRNFYETYMHATFVADGTTSNTKYIAFPTNGAFKSIPTSVITAPYGTGTQQYFYPDQFTPIAPALPAFYYVTSSRIGGLTYEGSYKLVYLGVGLEQLSQNAQNQIALQTKRFFDGEISGVEFDDLLIKGYSVYPNPATDQIRVNLPEAVDNVRVELVDVDGRVVLRREVSHVDSALNIDCSTVASGSYRLCLRAGDQGLVHSTLVNIVR